MNYSFEYIDIILLAMIAGFIFLRLRGILGKKTGFEEDISTDFAQDVTIRKTPKSTDLSKFDEEAKKEFIKGAKIAYETIITNFASGNLKDIKYLLDKNVFNQFNEAIKDRKNKSFLSETTFIGINSADIKNHVQNKNMLEVTVNFVSEIISCVRDKDKKIISGDPDVIKKVTDTWKFTKDIKSNNPNWLLVDTQVQLIKKISKKDKKDWQNFIDGGDKLENKDKSVEEEDNNLIEKTIDLHGYSIENANVKIKEFIEQSYSRKVNKINIITGKGSRSKNFSDPYQSFDLSILKYSVPQYIKNNLDLMKIIKLINYEAVNNPNQGSFDII